MICNERRSSERVIFTNKSLPIPAALSCPQEFPVRRPKFLGFFSLALFVCLTLPICIAEAAPELTPKRIPAGSDEALHHLVQGVQEMTLENGLRVLVYKRANAPVFAGKVWVGVGGVNETPGKTGAAHLLEHMAFKGTEQIGTKDYASEKVLLEQLDILMEQEAASPGSVKPEQIQDIYKRLGEFWVDNEFSRIYQQRGGVGLNAGTAKDYTVYDIELPTLAFELWCWMESERLLKPVFRQFYKERDVVREERRMRYDDNPGGLMYEALLNTAYRVHPNRMPVIGWAEDIRNLSRRDTEALHRTYYRPDNIVIALVGDLEFETVKRLVTKYFGRLPKPVEPLPVLTAVEPAQTAAREAVVTYDAEPSLVLGYHKPVYPHPDDIAFSVLHTLLSSGRSSLLYRELVLQKQLAVSVGTTEAPGEKYPSLFVITATPRQGVSSRTLANEIQKILDRLAKVAFSENEVEIAKKRVRVSFLQSLDSNESLADTLGHAELLWEDWRLILHMYDLVNMTTADDLQRLVRSYLVKTNRTFVRLEKPKAVKK